MRSFITSIAISALIAPAAASTQPIQAQTFTILHAFTAGADGAVPYAGLTMDKSGNLYGTAAFGGAADSGTVFKLSHKGSGWVFTPLYSFQGGNDGVSPQARVIFGRDGTLYGTTFYGGGGGCSWPGCGTVFNLRPPAHACKAVLCPWTKTMLYQFTGGIDGANPGLGDLIFDEAGNIYGTTIFGGSNDKGTVYELTPSNGGWTASVLYSFGGHSLTPSSNPYGGMIFDTTGNLYGTTTHGGIQGPSCPVSNDRGCGTVFKLTPSSGGWTETDLYDFTGGSDGFLPTGGVIFDQTGNLYGTTPLGGSGGGGTVFMLTPDLNGGWTFSLLYSFSVGYGSYASLTMDSLGNLYGTTYGDGLGYGNVFKLTPSSGGWTETDLYDFTGGSRDGGNPYCAVTVDAQGNIYGTASSGGFYGYGVVWEITP
jgi:uncharacterized repeat protein (TIGR03803 family)